MAEKSSIFDMIGPVMIGPSSSHTAGVVRIGKVAHRILGVVPTKAKITFYNSFARTYEGHGSDRAIIAGLLGYKTDDKRIKTSFEEAEKVGFEYSFHPVGNASTYHPNTVKIKCQSDEREIEVIGVSQGGGVISIISVDGFAANFSAAAHTLIVNADDKIGSISFISSILAHEDCNIATMNVSRKGKHEMACLSIEIDSGIREITLQYLQSLSWVHNVTYIPTID
ncbi:MAG: L-serine ammonia-lyase, iron-sulfur-dependent subunit beta [Flammeovirgaceae bacterium]